MFDSWLKSTAPSHKWAEADECSSGKQLSSSLTASNLVASQSQDFQKENPRMQLNYGI